MALETTHWDPTDHLNSPETERAYLEAAFDDGDWPRRSGTLA